ELRDQGGVVVVAGAGGDLVEGGGGRGDPVDLRDLVHERIDLVLMVVDRRAVLRAQHHLPGGAAQLGEAVGEGVDAALPLGAGDLDVGGEGAAQPHGEAADDHQQRDPGTDDLPAQGG